MPPAPVWARPSCCLGSAGSCADSGQVLPGAAPHDLLGPLLEFATNSDSGFLPLHGERDQEYQFGVTIPLYGWTVDVDHFRTQARNFFDHNAIGNSNLFLPLTIDGAVIRGNELAIRSPRFWSLARCTSLFEPDADGFGASTAADRLQSSGRLFRPRSRPEEYGQCRSRCEPSWAAYASINVYYGSGFANGERPEHLPGHAEVNLARGSHLVRAFRILTVLNLTNRHLLVDNSLTFGGFHYNDPRQIYARFTIVSAIE